MTSDVPPAFIEINSPCTNHETLGSQVLEYSKHNEQLLITNIRQQTGRKQPQHRVTFVMSTNPGISTLPSPMVIMLNGHPAVGKKAIGMELHHLLNPDIDRKDLRTHGPNSKFLHSGLINNLASALVPRDEERYVYLREQLLDRLYEWLRQGEDSSRIYLITANLYEGQNRADEKELKQYYEYLADKLELPFYWINLTCTDKLEHLRRLSHKTRDPGKTRDVDLLLEHRTNREYLPLRPLMPDEYVTWGLPCPYGGEFREFNTAYKSAIDVAEDIMCWLPGLSRDQRLKKFQDTPASRARYQARKIYNNARRIRIIRPEPVLITRVNRSPTPPPAVSNETQSSRLLRNLRKFGRDIMKLRAIRSPDRIRITKESDRT